MLMRNIQHGGDWSGFLRERGRFPLDFSANVSPLGMPPKAREAVMRLLAGDGARRAGMPVCPDSAGAHLPGCSDLAWAGLSACSDATRSGLPDCSDAAWAGLSAYPDPACRSLRRAIAARYGIRADQIFCGNGAADILYRLAIAYRPARALLIAPDFGEYAQALKTVGTEITYCRPDGRLLSPGDDEVLGADSAAGMQAEVQAADSASCVQAEARAVDDAAGAQDDAAVSCRRRIDAEIAGNMFELTDSFADHINNETDLVIFSNPNNPSGAAADMDLLERILEKCIACGTLLVVDECFLDFLPDADERTMLRFLSRSDGHLLVVRAFTKFYGMAGLRLGWCASSQERLCALQEAGPPWQVSTIAQAAGEAALLDTDYERELRALICRERDFLKEVLLERGYYVADGRANYLLFYSPDHTLGERLAEQGIMIRDCGSYLGLVRGWYRIAVRTHEENCCLLQHL